jgi:hypothetical protein
MANLQNTAISGNLTVTGSATLTTISGTSGQFTNITSSNLVINNTAVLGDVNAYVLYNSGINKIAITPGLYVTGSITASTNIDSPLVNGVSVGAGKAGSSNTVLGFYALSSADINTNYNVAVGNSSLLNNKSGFNVGIGYTALFSNVSGSKNIAIGANALSSNKDSSNNVAIGVGALLSNISSSGVIAIGTDSLRNMNNTFSQPGNLAIGDQTLYNNTTGNNNLVIGNNSMYNNTVGSFNVSVGISTLQNNTSGSYNVSVGQFTLQNNLIGDSNVALGYSSLISNKSSYNIGIGAFALQNSVSGSGNISIGNNAGSGLLTGSNNIFIGHQAATSITDISNTVIIAPNGVERLRINSSGVTSLSGSLVVTGSATLTTVSGTTAQFTTLTGSTITGSTAQFTVVSASVVSASSYVGLPTSSGGTPGATDTTVQFNSGSTFSGSNRLTWDYINNILTVSGTISASNYLGITGGGGLQSETTRTINLSSSMTVADMQTQIDGIGKYIPSGSSVTVQFADGTYTINNTLRFQGFFGGGDLNIVGNLTETTSSHSNQAVILDATSVQDVVLVNIENCRLKTTVDRIQFKINSSSLGPSQAYSCIKSTNSDALNINSSYFSGSAGPPWSSYPGTYGMHLINVSAKISNNVCTGLEHFISCYDATKAVSVNNTTTGNTPFIALNSLSSIIFRSGTQPSGAGANTNTGDGGQIY